MSALIHPLPEVAPQTARFDLYGPIHKAIRRFVNATLDRFGALDIGDDAALQAALDEAQQLLDGLRGHLKHENDFIHTAIEARQPGGPRETAEQHVDHLEAIAALEADLALLRAAPAAQRETRVARLYRRLALFAAENLHHMHLEETANNELLWTHYSDTELREIHERLVAHVPPPEMAMWLRWMAMSLTPAELAGMLAGMQAKAPPQAFRAATAAVRASVDDARWSRLAGLLGLDEGASR
jgi:hypothetical protein